MSKSIVHVKLGNSVMDPAYYTKEMKDEIKREFQTVLNNPHGGVIVTSWDVNVEIHVLDECAALVLEPGGITLGGLVGRLEDIDAGCRVSPDSLVNLRPE